MTNQVANVKEVRLEIKRKEILYRKITVGGGMYSWRNDNRKSKVYKERCSGKRHWRTGRREDDATQRTETIVADVYIRVTEESVSNRISTNANQHFFSSFLHILEATYAVKRYKREFIAF